MKNKTKLLAATIILTSQLALPATSLAATQQSDESVSSTSQSQETSETISSTLDSSIKSSDSQSNDEVKNKKTAPANPTADSDKAAEETTKDSTKDASDESIDDWMPDKNLQAIVAGILGKNDFTKEDMLSITSASVDDVTVKDVKGISYAKNLASLTVTNSDLSNTANMAEIGTLTKLETIVATNDNLKDFSFLASSQLISLTNVDISNNSLTDLNSLKGASFPKMETFNISNNQLMDITILENIDVPKLKILNASSNKISDITPIKHSKIVSVEQLIVANNLIEDTSAFKDSTLTNLKMLDVSNNKIKDISVMKGLQSRYPNLQSFNASGNQISDITFMEGYNLTPANAAVGQKYVQDITMVRSIDPDKKYYTIPLPIKSVSFAFNEGGTINVTPDAENEGLNLMYGMGMGSPFYVNYFNGDFGSFWDGTATSTAGIKSLAVTEPQGNNNSMYTFGWTGAAGVFQGQANIYVNWINAQAPVIEAADQTIQVGDTFDPKAKVTAYDQQKDGSDKVDLTKDIKVLENNVNTKKPGVYPVNYSVTNSYGVKTDKSISVTVEDKKADTAKVTFNAGKGGSLSGNTTLEVPKGTKVTDLPKTVANKNNIEDIYFLDWYQNGKAVNPKNVTINGDTTFTAKFGAAVYRLYNKNNGDHLLTKNKNEKNKIAAKGWKVETNPKNDYGRAAFYVPVQADSAGKKTVYRIYNPNSGEHFYTTNKSEADAAVKKGWRHETDSNYTWVSEGDVKIYREFNPDVHTAGSHNFTTDLKEHKDVVAHGWRDESKDSSLWTVLKAGF
ncbi:leucine-rich repeat domain-containing protein [Enterococcus gilvus]|uniref:leucine-rich repeat domain-containing protein n=1 Tax=Enterococcus gilvus TaxID=160453 RepID=UPI0028D177CB|nr:leucine-rich repeat domain-containing protein [Enterococcus gilvus]